MKEIEHEFLVHHSVCEVIDVFGSEFVSESLSNVFKGLPNLRIKKSQINKAAQFFHDVDNGTFYAIFYNMQNVVIDQRFNWRKFRKEEYIKSFIVPTFGDQLSFDQFNTFHKLSKEQGLTNFCILEFNHT